MNGVTIGTDTLLGKPDIFYSCADIYH